MTGRTETLTDRAAPAFAQEGSYVDWSSIFAGAVVATSIAFVFSTFGAALGLTLTSPYDGEGSASAALIAVGSWMLWTTISSFMAGGYIAGRMRRRVDGASADEVSIRDGIHGLTVWGVAVLLGAVLMAATAGTAVQATADTLAAVAPAISDAAGGTDAGSAMQAQGSVAMTDAEAMEAAEAARKYGIVSAFVLAASLMISGAAAYWAAGMGGQHRDEGRAFARFGRWA